MPERRPRIVVVGLGPAGEDLLPQRNLELLVGARRRYLRTVRHPAAAAAVAAVSARGGSVTSFDAAYDAAGSFDEVYRTIAAELVAAATDEAAAGGGAVVYAVPGSPLIAERTVELLRADARVALKLVPAPSFLDLAWDRLGVDPIEAGVRLVDGTTFAVSAAGERGPLLVAQCYSRRVLSEIKLAADDAAGADPDRAAVLLHHLGLPDERVVLVAWADIDRTLDADHLTSLWVPTLAAPVASELVRLEELVRTLRARCPWDMRQTHGSLARHLLEESYEALDALDALDAAEPDPPPATVHHLEEELGDLLFQVVFHAVLAAEEGRFTLADVAHAVHDKLVGRHPHVFGDAVADTPEEVAARWEVLKQAEKGRTSVFEGIPAALPALALAAKLQRKAESIGVRRPDLASLLARAATQLEELATVHGPAAAAAGSGETLEGPPEAVRRVGDLLFTLTDAARCLGVDAEAALRSAAARFRRVVESGE